MRDDDEALRVAQAVLKTEVQVQFVNTALLRQALRHSSHTKDLGEDPLTSNERLEFLGDAVVQLAVSDYLYRASPSATEGEMSAWRAGLVQGVSLARVAGRMGLDRAVLLGGNLRQGRARATRAVFGAAFEAVIGALYLDQGWEVARDCVVAALAEALADPAGRIPRNHKGLLNEWTQRERGMLPRYEVQATLGPPHEREFSVVVWLGEEIVGRGRGGSKKDAEQLAAADALRQLCPPPEADGD